MSRAISDETRALTQPDASVPRFRQALNTLPLLQVAVLIGLAAVLVATVPAIANQRSINAVLIIASLLALAAMGQTLVVILGGLDLTVPGYITFGAFAASNLAGMAGWPWPLMMVFVIAVCASIGAFVGFICHQLKIQPLVVTLGFGAVLTGGTLFLAGSDYSSAPPDALRDLTKIKSTTFGIPVPPVVFIVIILAVLTWLFLTRTPAGRRLYATGISPRAAALTRIHTGAVWTLVFAVSGALAGVAGIFIASFGSGWSQAVGDPYFYSGLAAVIVGGTTFGSIRGSYTRTVLGAVILTLLATIIVSNGLAEAQSRIVYGLIIIGVVALYGRDRHVRDRF